MQFETLPVPEERFQLVQELGVGSYGRVSQALDKTTGSMCAVKIMSQEADEEGMSIDEEEMAREVHLMKGLGQNEFIVSYYGAYFVPRDGEVWISMEFCEIGSCLDLIRLLQVPFPEVVVQSITKDMLMGLRYLHEQNVVHRDLKGGNVLLTNGGRARLTDFGVSGFMEGSKRMTIIGSPYWMAPEVIREVGYSFPADVWGLGITVIEMLEMLPPRAALHPMKVLLQIPALPPPKLEDKTPASDALVDFLSFCLVKIPDARRSAAELLEHAWIEQKAQPQRVADLILRGLELITKYGGRAEAMKNRDAGEDDNDETPDNRKRKKKAQRKNANMTIRLEAKGTEVSASEVEPQPKQKYSSDVAVVMKKLTRILRSVKSIRARAEAGDEPIEKLAAELAECGKAITDITDPAIESEVCQKNLRKLSSELRRVMSMLQGNRSDSLKKDSATPSSPLDSPKPKARKTRVKKSSSSKKKDGQIADFQRQVREYHLEAFIDGLLALGVERAMDLKFVSDEDLDNLGMKPIQKKKLLSLMPAEEVSGSSVAGSKPVARKKKKKKKPAAGSASPPRESTSPNQTLAAAPSSPASPPPTSNPPPTPPSIAPPTPPSNAPPPAPQSHQEPQRKASYDSPVQMRRSVTDMSVSAASPAGPMRRSSLTGVGPRRPVPAVPPGGPQIPLSPVTGRAAPARPPPPPPGDRGSDVEKLKQDREALAARLAKVQAEKLALELEKRRSSGSIDGNLVSQGRRSSSFTGK